jgi:hypothetical protein
MALGEAMYQTADSSDGQNANQGNGSGDSAGNEDEDIVEGEFEAI